MILFKRLLVASAFLTAVFGVRAIQSNPVSLGETEAKASARQAECYLDCRDSYGGGCWADDWCEQDCYR